MRVVRMSGWIHICIGHYMHIEGEKEGRVRREEGEKEGRRRAVRFCPMDNSKVHISLEP